VTAVQMPMVCCGSELDEKATELLDQLDAPGYTVCRQATEKGSAGLKRKNPIWLESVNVVPAFVPEELVPEVVERGRKARDA